MHQPGLATSKPARQIKGEQLLVKIDVQPLAPSASYFVTTQADHCLADAGPTQCAVNHDVLKPRVITAVPDDIYEAD